LDLVRLMSGVFQVGSMFSAGAVYAPRFSLEFDKTPAVTDRAYKKSCHDS
jgi:hypothetical protein